MLCGTAAYAAFLWALVQQGLVAAASREYYLLLGSWSAGLAVLVLRPYMLQRLPDDMVVWARSLWCNFGAIALALLVNHPIRMLLLVVPLFGLFYCALHLSKRQVGVLALLTWVGYTLCAAQLGLSVITPGYELLYFVAFALIMLGGLFIAWELLRVRDELRERNTHLRQVMERMQTLALQDELTGVHNRRYILEVLARQKSLADRGQQPFTLCYCDLDHFKTINDQFGHATGDMVLRKFARMAAATVRSIDFVARIGGEEFLLVLVGADRQAADTVIKRLTRGTKQMRLDARSPRLSLSVSVGVTSYRPEETVDAVLKRADRALYTAKESGRDRVVVA